jgi:hypothetical protein
MYDIRTKADIDSALDSQAIADTNTHTGETIDTKGYEALDFCFNFEITTATSITIAIYEGDESDMSDEAAVDSSQLIGALVISSTGSQTAHIGYVGNKRYVRAKVTGAGSVSVVASGIAYKGRAAHQPTYSA